MNSNHSNVYLLVAATLWVHLAAYSQTVTTANDGVWENPVTWVGGIVPTSASATAIIVNHDVLISGPGPMSASNVLVNGRLTLATGAVLNILADGLANPDLRVSGTLVCNDSSQLNGTSALATIFDAGAFYVHRQGPAGFIPMATWDPASTLQLSGFTVSGYINIAHSDGWKQAFGNVIYDCPAQTIFVVDLNGYLRNVAGSFTVRSTNNKTLRLSTTQNPTINIAGDFIVEGSSEVWLSTNSTACQVNIGGKFIYRSTSTGPSYLTTRGIVTLNVSGDFEMSSVGPIRMASSAPDSVGTRQATMLLGGNLSVLSGTLIAPPPGSGRGRIYFRGSGLQHVVASSAGTSFQGNMEYDVGPACTVDLASSMLSSDLGSLNVHGTLAVGAMHPGGAIQTGGQGNIRIPGPRNFDPGSTIVYNGSSQQVIGNGHPVSADVNLICNNPSGIQLMSNLTVGDFVLQRGNFNESGHQVMIGGNVTFDPSAITVPSAVTLVGNKTQTLSFAGFTLNTLIIAKEPNSMVKLTSSLTIRDQLKILSSNTVLSSFGHLTLLSESDNANGTATVGPIPSGSAIEGDVTVERFMAGEGRIYRYIAASVTGASVASLMDDFPVTGTFQDPSTESTQKALRCFCTMSQPMDCYKGGSRTQPQVCRRLTCWKQERVTVLSSETDRRPRWLISRADLTRVMSPFRSGSRHTERLATDGTWWETPMRRPLIGMPMTARATARAGRRKTCPPLFPSGTMEEEGYFIIGMGTRIHRIWSMAILHLANRSGSGLPDPIPD